MEKKTVGNFFITTLNGMAYGLFATLIIGTILATIGSLFNYGAGNPFCDAMVKVFGTNAQKGGISMVFQYLTGAGIGVGVALALKLSPLKTITLGVVGEVAAFFSLNTTFVTTYETSNAFQVGDPLTIYLAVIVTALAIKFVLKKETPVDIILIPLFGAIVGLAFSIGIRYPAIYITYGVQWMINQGTTLVPFLMGIVVSVLMGMALTCPISSAAIAAMIFGSISIGDPGSTGLLLASGAAVVGCSTQMIGFAVQSYRDNNIGKVISVGIGTSMLQFKNICKNPLIWLPTIITSAILGPISTCWLQLVCTGASAGMGTAGLVGPIGTISSMGVTSWQAWVGVIFLQIILPGILVFLFDLLFRKLKWIKPGDLTI